MNQMQKQSAALSEELEKSQKAAAVARLSTIFRSKELQEQQSKNVELETQVSKLQYELLAARANRVDERTIEVVMQYVRTAQSQLAAKNKDYEDLQERMAKLEDDGSSKVTHLQQASKQLGETKTELAAMTGHRGQLDADLSKCEEESIATKVEAGLREDKCPESDGKAYKATQQAKPQKIIGAAPSNESKTTTSIFDKKTEAVNAPSKAPATLTQNLGSIGAKPTNTDFKIFSLPRGPRIQLSRLLTLQRNDSTIESSSLHEHRNRHTRNRIISLPGRTSTSPGRSRPWKIQISQVMMRRPSLWSSCRLLHSSPLMLRRTSPLSLKMRLNTPLTSSQAGNLAGI